MPLTARLSDARKALLATLVGAAVAGPLLVGSPASSHARAAERAPDGGAPAFRNVSIKLSAQGDGPQRFGFERGGKALRIENRSLASLITFAYDVAEQQVIGPESLKRPTYDITAEAPASTGLVRDQTQALLRKLLADHFGLRVQQERQEMNGYVLRIDSSGSKLKPHEGEPAPSFRMTTGSLSGTGVQLELLRKALSRHLDMLIVDETGIVGLYDYTIVWASETSPQRLPNGASRLAAERAAVMNALQEQLGLRLETRRVTVDVIKVIRAKKPEDIVTTPVATE